MGIFVTRQKCVPDYMNYKPIIRNLRKDRADVDRAIADFERILAQPASKTVVRNQTCRIRPVAIDSKRGHRLSREIFDGRETRQ